MANDTDSDSQSLTAIKASDPAHGALTLNADGGFSYTPRGDFAGSDSFTYQSSDGSALSSPVAVTITVTPLRCVPRPSIRTQVTAGGGRLSVHVEATAHGTGESNALREFRFGEFQNARVTLNGQPETAGQRYPVPPATAASIDFTVERATPGQPTTVSFTVVDDCGEWPSFVGGGPGAF